MGGGYSKHSLCYFCEDFGVLEEVVLLVADFYRVATPAREENAVAGFDRERDDVALAVGGAGSDRDDRGLGERRRGCGGGQEDARRGFGVWLEALDEDAVEERGDGADGLDGERGHGERL